MEKIALKVKEETVIPVTTHCHGCLSTDRTLTIPKDNLHIFVLLFGAQSLEAGCIIFCWECAAMLQKIGRFRQQVQFAQHFFQEQTVYQHESVQCLSTLTKTFLEPLNIIQETEYDKKDGAFIEIISNVNTNNVSHDFSVVSDQIQKVYANHDLHAHKDENSKKIEITLCKEEGDDYDDESQNLEIVDDIEIKEELQNIKEECEQQEPDRNRKAITRNKKSYSYECHARKTVNTDVDLENFERLFEDSVLTEEEIKSEGKQYERLSNKLKTVCRPCRKRFTNVLDLQRHKTFCHILKEKAQGPYNCLACKEPCMDADSLRTHWIMHNQIKRCKLCNEVIPCRYLMKRHLQEHEHKYSCKECFIPGVDVTFYSFRDFKEHYKALHTYAECDHCGRKQRTKRTLSKHMRIFHLPPVCCFCNKLFKSYSRLVAHLHRHHYELIRKDMPPELSYCVECDKQFPNVVKYKYHLANTKTHNPAAVENRRKLVSCPECGREFTRTYYMRNHYRQMHSKQSKHQCRICHKTLNSAWSLKKHIEGVHHKIRDPKNKICDICGRGFGSNAVLKKHIRTHTGERPYECSHCPAAFTQVTPLKSHLRTQHKVF